MSQQLYLYPRMLVLLQFMHFDLNCSGNVILSLYLGLIEGTVNKGALIVLLDLSFIGTFLLFIVSSSRISITGLPPSPKNA